MHRSSSSFAPLFLLSACASPTAGGVLADDKRPETFCDKHPTHHACAPPEDTGTTGDPATSDVNVGDCGMISIEIPDVIEPGVSVATFTAGVFGTTRADCQFDAVVQYQWGDFWFQVNGLYMDWGPAYPGDTNEIQLVIETTDFVPYTDAFGDITNYRAYGCAFSWGTESMHEFDITVDENEANRCIEVPIVF
jgi:hypothetical protein